MANPLTPEPGISGTGAPVEVGAYAPQWGYGPHSTYSTSIIGQNSPWLQIASLSMNGTPTPITAATTGYVPVTNGTVFLRPQYESHVFFTSHWILSASADSSGTSTSLTISIQTWLNGYHVLISPSGFANDWTETIPPIPANQSAQFSRTFVGAIFNVEFRRAPDAHIIQFMYSVQSFPAHWTNVSIMPRMTLVETISTTQMSFVSSNPT